MEHSSENRRQLALAAALTALALLILSLLAAARDSTGRLSGDEGTYRAMAESLAVDGDFAFTEADEARVETARQAGRKTLILQRTEDGISYSKPLLPALLAAPFVMVGAGAGFVALNVVLLLVAGWLLWLYARRLGPPGQATLTVVTVMATGALLPYAFWSSSDTLQAVLALAGLTLTVGGLRQPHPTGAASRVLDSPWAAVIGGVLLGLLVAVRPPYALIAGIAPGALAVGREWRSALRVTVVIGVTVTGMLVSTWAIVGAPIPYKAERATFNTESGYPAGNDLEEVSAQFERGRATSSLGAVPNLEPRVSFFASLYFLVGRHTGVLVYFPAGLFLVLAALRSGDRMSVVVLLGVAATSLFFLVWLPFNYFGGGSCIGNRYFLAAYCALPLALTRPLGRWSVAGCWLLAVVVGASAVASERLPANLDESSQSHVHAGLFRLLPYETTASDIEGSRDRYFGKDFVRSVDPFVAAEPWSFGLESERPPAEFVLANLIRDEPLRLHVHSGTRNITLVYSDYARTMEVPVPVPEGARGVVEIQPSLPRRFHPLWFRNVWDHGKPYWVRVFRLAVRGSGEAPVSATVRFLGRSEFPPPFFERTVLRGEIPRQAVAGSTSTVMVRVRNDSHLAWSSDDLFPVYLSYRLRDAGGGAVEGARVRLPGRIGPRQDVEVPLEIRWPAVPGVCALRIDLVAEGVDWFERRVGEPLAAQLVELTASGVEGTGD